MSTARRRLTSPRPAHRARGFTLVELMVAVAIAMFLLFGLFTIFENTRTTYGNQQALAQLQDQQRFAMQLITSVVESGGYYSNATGDTASSALLAVAPNFGSGQAFYGTGTAAPAPNSDTLYVRFQTASGDGIINCSGGQNTTGANHTYTNELSVVGGQLLCTLTVDGGAAAAPLPLVNGLVNMQVWYGVNRSPPFVDYNVDTYVSAANMVNTDWSQVSAVRVLLTFTNPLAGQAGQQPTLNFERVIQVMARAGVHT